MFSIAPMAPETDIPAPPVVDRATWRRRRDELLVTEKAHTRAGDAIAAARRRLPMTEVRNVSLDGQHGPTPLLDMFGDHDQLLTVKHMWHAGEPFENQCEGCTATIWNFQDPVYLEARGVAFAVWCQGPRSEYEPFRRFMGYTMPWYSVHGVDEPGVSDGWINAYLRVGSTIYQTYDTDGRGSEAMMPAMLLADLTVYGRKESWEDSPEGWPQPHRASGGSGWWRWDGRPVAQWTRPGVGHGAVVGSDAHDGHCH